MTAADKSWVPLEANSEVLSCYLATLGVEGAYFTDVFGLDAELLAMVPTPVLATLLVFPLTPENEALRSASPTFDTSKCFFMKQHIRNACGTVAITHAIGNLLDKLRFTEGSIIKRFLDSVSNASPDERAAVFDMNSDIDAAQAVAASDGASERPEPTTDTNLHFICHVMAAGHAVELDGRQAGPIDLGVCDDASLLLRSAARAKELMAANPNDVNWTIVALCGC